MSVEGIPEGYELVAVRQATNGETIFRNGQVVTWIGGAGRPRSIAHWPILKALPKKLVVQEGKYYKSVNGQVWGPMTKGGIDPGYPFYLQGKYWSEHGVRYINWDRDTENLVEEVPAPKPPEPEYRPFASAKEFETRRDEWIVRKSGTDNLCFRIPCYRDQGFSTADGVTAWQVLFDQYTFEDGTPCGVKI